jgi:putative transposase
MPFAGSRMLRDLLRGEGARPGGSGSRRGCSGWGSRRSIAVRIPRNPQMGTRFFPTLRGVTIERPNQVWAMDITYIPMARGCVYLTAVVDRFSWPGRIR